MSKKRQAEAPERRDLVKRLLSERPRCEFPTILGEQTVKMCHRASRDLHEVLSRGRGGSFLDESNILCLCREHHEWIGANPVEANRLGVWSHSWEG